MIRIAIADDQAMIRQALATLLDLEEDIEVVLQATDGADLLERMSSDVDLVLMDVEMPRVDGLTACASLKRRWPRTKVLFVTTFGRPGYVRRALEAGASGFVVKDAPLPELASAIRTVASGGKVVDSSLAVATLTRGESVLTPRETETLQAMRGGRTTADAARKLGLSQGTVRNYISNAMDKTGARSAAEAVELAERNGWLDPAL